MDKSPQSLDAERSILGGILLENSSFLGVSDLLQAEDFSLDSHRCIWLRMVELFAEEIPIDIVLLAERLERVRDLERVGGTAYLSSLLNGVPDRPSLVHYARAVKEASMRRALLSVCGSFEKLLADPTEKTAGIIAKAQGALMEISRRQTAALDSVPIFETYSQFEGRSTGKVEWTVDGLIQRGANGLVLAGPKAGKSLAVADLAIALASGQEWLGFSIPHRVRVAIVSREDYWALTHSRMKRYREGRAVFAEELDEYLRLNCRGAQPGVVLDRPDDVAALIGQLKKQKTEFLIFDVLRVLHSAEENDSTEMQREVINPLNRIAEEVGCSICVIHHSPKDVSLGVSRSARGTSAILGWAEFAIGISMADEDSRTRELEFQIKAADAPQAFYWRAIDTPGGMLKLTRVNWSPPPKRGTKAAQAVWWDKVDTEIKPAAGD